MSDRPRHSPPPYLRLVRDGLPHADLPPAGAAMPRAIDLRRDHQPVEVVDPARLRDVRQSIVRENRGAAINPDLDPTDPRWLLAARTAARLEGALLTPEARAHLLRTAQRLQLPPFDANVILAIVQERARRGESLAGASPLIELIPTPIGRERDELGATLTRVILASISALMLALILIRWISS